MAGNSSISKRKYCCSIVMYEHVCCCTILLTNFLPCYINTSTLRACLHGGGGLQVGGVTCGGSPHLSCKRDLIKCEIIWTGGLPHLSGLPHLPGVPHFHVNRRQVMQVLFFTHVIFFADGKAIFFFFIQLLPILEIGLHRRSMIRMLSCFLSAHRNLRILHSLDDWSCC